MALPILDGNQTAATLSTIITGGAHIPAHTVVSLGSQAISDITSGVSGSVVSISNFPSTQTVAGTVTANAVLDFTDGGDNIASDDGGTEPSLGVQLGYWDSAVGEYRLVRQSAGLPVSGVVTANVDPTNSFGNGQGSGWRGVVQQGIMDHQENEGFTVRIAGTAEPALIGFVNINSCPTGGLTTRFGSVTTANTAQITSAVTNTNRKYLLAQNISAGTVTIGIGFSPTTTQGIQLPAGGGLTFDAFCPTGAVYWLGAVTGAAFTILEG